MIKKFIEFTLKNKVFVNLVFFLLMAVGVMSLMSLPVERYPNVKMGKVYVSCIYPGASAEDVEALITKKIEDSLEDVENVEYIQSKSYPERSSVLVKFLDDVDYDEGYDEVRYRVLGLGNELPQDADPSHFFKLEVSQWLPAVTVNLIGDRSNRALSLMGDQMKIPLRRITGVKEVSLEGEYTREFHIFLDPDRMDRFGVSFEQVVRALQSANFSVPAGDFTGRDGEYVVRVDERFKGPDQVGATVIRKDGQGSFVTVSDVLDEAKMGYRDPYVVSSVNGESCVSLHVVKSDEGNVMDIVPAVEKIVDEFRPLLEAEGVRVVYTQDQRVDVEDAMNTLISNMLVGIALVCLILWLFLGFRNAFLTSAGIPFSFLVTMAIMYATGGSLNEITLFSFVLVSGIIVDDAIVVVENIHRHVQSGLGLRDAVVEGASEVFLPVIAATSTTAAAFLPMLIMSGSTGEFFAEVPKAVTAAIAASLVECLLILPSHFFDWPGSKKIMRLQKQERTSGENRQKQQKEGRFLAPLKKGVMVLTGICMRFRWLSLVSVVLVFAVAMYVLVVSITGSMPLIKIKFFPDEYRFYYVEMQGPAADPIENISERLKDVSKYLMDKGPGQTKSCTAQAGFYLNEDYEQIYAHNNGNIVVELPKNHNRDFPDNPENDPVAFLEKVRSDLQSFTNGGYIIRVRPEKGGPPAGKDLNVRVVGSNVQSVSELASHLMKWIKDNPEIGPYLTDLADNQGRPNRVYRFRPIPSKAAEFNTNPTEVGLLAASVLDGRYAGKFKASDEEIDMKVKLSPKAISSPDQALNIPLFEHVSGPVRLKDLCEVDKFMEPGLLNRYEGMRSINLASDIKPGARVSAPSIVHLIKTHFEKIRSEYPGADLNFAGAYESTRQSYISLAYAFLIAVFIMYMILATQFQSYAQPLIILSAIIFSLIGVIFGALVTQTVFTVNSFVATVGVTGVVVNDSLVLIDFINRAYRRGMSRRESIMEGVNIRFRPILLTTLTTTLGLMPMALGIPEYSTVWGAMATTFVTGLCTATLLTLFIVPVQWDVLMGIVEWRQRRKERREGEA